MSRSSTCSVSVCSVCKSKGDEMSPGELCDVAWETAVWHHLRRLHRPFPRPLSEELHALQVLLPPGAYRGLEGPVFFLNHSETFRFQTRYFLKSVKLLCIGMLLPLLNDPAR